MLFVKSKIGCGVWFSRHCAVPIRGRLSTGSCMSVLLNLPDDLCRNILAEWFDVQLWGTLDRALGNGKLRELYLRYMPLLSCKLPIPASYDGHHSYEEFYRWIHARGVVLTEIELYDVMFMVSNFTVPPFIRLENIRELRAASLHSVRINNIVNFCPNLTKVICRAWHLDFPSLRPNFLPNLTYLDIQDEEEFESSSSRVKYGQENYHKFEMIRDHCRSLKTLIARLQCDDRETDPVIKEILKFNPQLHDIDVPGGNAILDHILTMFGKQLTKLTVVHLDFDERTAARCLRECPNVGVLNVSNSESVRDDLFILIYHKAIKLKLFAGRILDLESWLTMIRLLEGVPVCEVVFSVPLSHKGILPLFERIGYALTTFELTCDERVSSASVESVLAKCPNVTDLTLQLMNGINCREVLVNVPLVRRLDMQVSLDVDEILQTLEVCRYLEECSFVDEPVMDRYKGFTLINALKQYQNEQGTKTSFKFH